VVKTQDGSAQTWRWAEPMPGHSELGPKGVPAFLLLFALMGGSLDFLRPLSRGEGCERVELEIFWHWRPRRNRRNKRWRAPKLNRPIQKAGALTPPIIAALIQCSILKGSYQLLVAQKNANFSVRSGTVTLSCTFRGYQGSAGRYASP